MARLRNVGVLQQNVVEEDYEFENIGNSFTETTGLDSADMAKIRHVTVQVTNVSSPGTPNALVSVRATNVNTGGPITIAGRTAAGLPGLYTRDFSEVGTATITPNTSWMFASPNRPYNGILVYIRSSHATNNVNGYVRIKGSS